MSITSISEEFFIQPTVIFTILDIFLRKPQTATDVIGILLGTKVGNVTTVEEAFFVSHEMDAPESVRLDLNSIDRLAAAFRSQNAKYQVVGWFTTYTTILLSHQLIQTTLASRFNCPSLLMLVVDPHFTTSKKLSIVGYVHHEVLSGAHTRFSVVPVKHIFYEQDRAVLDVMVNGHVIGDGLDAPSVVSTESQLFDETLSELQTTFTKISTYLDNTMKSGQTEMPEHKQICRQIAQVLSQVPMTENTPTTTPSPANGMTSHQDGYDELLTKQLADLALFAQISTGVQQQIATIHDTTPSM